MNRSRILIGILMLAAGLFGVWTVMALCQFWTLACTVDRTLAVAVVVALWGCFGVMLLMVRELLKRREVPTTSLPVQAFPLDNRSAPPFNALLAMGWIEGD